MFIVLLSPMALLPWFPGVASGGEAAPSLRSLASPLELSIGTCVNGRTLRSDGEYRRVLAREFNSVTSENGMKWRAIQPRRGEFDFSRADALMEFAEENGMAVRGHTLVWHSYNPAWLEEGEWSPEELRGLMREHIFKTLDHCRGRVYCWDVVNEAWTEDGGLQKGTVTGRSGSVWPRILGEEYVELAFRLAREADPDVKLFYNDFGFEGMNAKSETVYAKLKASLAKGVPIDGVGLQMHVSLDDPVKPEELSANIRRLGELGLEVHITELDIRIKEPATEEDLRNQARLFSDYLRVCLEDEACPSFTLWGFTDRSSWIPGFFEGYGSAAPFGRDLNPKPAHGAMLEVLRERLES